MIQYINRMKMKFRSQNQDISHYQGLLQYDFGTKLALYNVKKASSKNEKNRRSGSYAEEK